MSKKTASSEFLEKNEAYEWISTSEFTDSIESQNARINKLASTIEISKETLTKVYEKISSQENIRIEEKTYYEGGSLQSEKAVLKNKVSSLEKEAIESFEKHIFQMQHRYDSLSFSLSEYKKEYRSLAEEIKKKEVLEREKLSNIKSKNKTGTILFLVVMVMTLYLFGKDIRKLIRKNTANLL